MIRLITGPPGAGKNTYVEKHMKDGDVVVDFDVLREQHPYMSLEQLKTVRTAVEDTLSTLQVDAWVIRCAADAEKREELASKLGAVEVVVLETDAETAKARIRERGRDQDLDQIDSAVDNWWSQYGVVGSDVIVRPDKAAPSDTENKMSQSNEEGTDKGFPPNTPVADMKPEEQTAYWKHNSRKHENASKAKDVEISALKAEKPEAVDVDALTAEIRKNLRAEDAPGLVRSQFKSAVAGRLSDEALEALVEDLDHTKYLKDDGTIDTARIATKAALIAPVDTRRSVRTHQGQRKVDGSTSVSKGKTLYEETHGSK